MVFMISGMMAPLTLGARTSASQQATNEKLRELKKKIHALDKKFADLQKKANNREFPSFDVASIAEGRLTTESGVALSTSDRSATDKWDKGPFPFNG